MRDVGITRLNVPMRKEVVTHNFKKVALPEQVQQWSETINDTVLMEGLHVALLLIEMNREQNLI